VTFPVAHRVSADEYNSAVAAATALDALGFVAEKRDVTSNVGGTTPEFVSSFIQFATVVGVRYRVSVGGPYESSIAGDVAILKVRLAATTTDITGTVLRTWKGGCDSASKGNQYSFTAQFVASATGTQTVVCTTKRDSGTGTLRQNAATTDGEIYWLIESFNN
jgi:hypothetical protein